MKPEDLTWLLNLCHECLKSPTTQKYVSLVSFIFWKGKFCDVTSNLEANHDPVWKLSKCDAETWNLLCTSTENRLYSEVWLLLVKLAYPWLWNFFNEGQGSLVIQRICHERFVEKCVWIFNSSLKLNCFLPQLLYVELKLSHTSHLLISLPDLLWSYKAVSLLWTYKPSLEKLCFVN